MADFLAGLQQIKTDLEEKQKNGETGDAAKETEKKVEEEQKEPEQIIDQADPQDEPADDEAGDEEHVAEEDQAKDGESEEDRRQRMIKTRQANRREKEKAERKKLEEDLAREREERAKDRERLARLEGTLEASKKPEPAKKDEDPEPDAELFPEDHNRWSLRQVNKRLEAQDKILKDQEVQNKLTHFKSLVAQAEDEFVKTNPKADYKGAEGYMVEMNVKLKMAGNPKMTEAQARAETESQKMQLFQQVARDGGNPMETVIRLAQAQGYTGKKEEQPKAKANLEKVSENQRKSANLIGGSSASANGKLTSDQVLHMSAAKLAELKAKDPNYMDKIVQ